MSSLTTVPLRKLFVILLNFTVISSQIYVVLNCILKLLSIKWGVYICEYTAVLRFFRAIKLLFSKDQQQHHHLGACWKFRILGFTHTYWIRIYVFKNLQLIYMHIKVWGAILIKQSFSVGKPLLIWIRWFFAVWIWFKHSRMFSILGSCVLNTCSIFP